MRYSDLVGFFNSGIELYPGTWKKKYKIEESYIQSFDNCHSIDYFYTLLLYYSDRRGLVDDSIFSRRASKENIFELLEDGFTLDEQMFTSCSDVVSRVVELSDIDLTKKLLDTFSVSNLDISDISLDSFIYTKLNHGFWEFFLNSHIQEVDKLDNSRLREIPNKRRVAGERNSNFYYALLELMKTELTNQSIEFGISLSAGTESINKTLSKPLNMVSRSAGMGLLACHEVFDIGSDTKFRDGSEPRNLLVNKTFDKFVDNHVNQSEVVIVIGPSHLNKLDFPDLSGQLIYLPIPNSVVHEAWESVLVTCIGAIRYYLQTFSSLTVLIQAANFSSLLALALSKCLSKQEIQKMKYVDLGRCMDICSYDKMVTYPSFKVVDPEYLLYLESKYTKNQ